MTTVLTAVLLALSLGGTTLKKNPKAPSARQVMVYAPDSADHMLFVDLEGSLPAAISAIKNLAKEPVLKSFPEAMREVERMLGQLDGGLAMATAGLGFHPVKDLNWMAAWVRYQSEAVEWLVVLRGKLGKDPLGKLAALMNGQVVEIRGRGAVKIGPNLIMRGADGALLIGSPAWIEERSLATWTPLKAKGLMKKAAKLFRAKPWFLLASQPSDTTRRRYTDVMRDPDLAIVRDLATGHAYSHLWLAYNGMGWAWQARDKRGFENAAMVSTGMIEVMRASQIGARGVARILLAGLSIWERNETVARILEHRDRILALVLEHTSAGDFKAKVATNAGKKLVSVSATADSLEKVLPIGAFLPMIGGAAAFWLVRMEAPAGHGPAEVEVERVPPPAKTDKKEAPEKSKARPRPDSPAPAPAPVREPEPMDEEEGAAEPPGMDVNPGKPTIKPKPADD